MIKIQKKKKNTSISITLGNRRGRERVFTRILSTERRHDSVWKQEKERSVLVVFLSFAQETRLGTGLLQIQGLQGSLFLHSVLGRSTPLFFLWPTQECTNHTILTIRLANAKTPLMEGPKRGPFLFQSEKIWDPCLRIVLEKCQCFSGDITGKVMVENK